MIEDLWVRTHLNYQADRLKLTAVGLEQQALKLRELAFQIEMTPGTFVWIDNAGPDGYGLYGGKVGMILKIIHKGPTGDYTIGFLEPETEFVAGGKKYGEVYTWSKVSIHFLRRVDEKGRISLWRGKKSKVITAKEMKALAKKHGGQVEL
jgi:hypothetical protein